MERKKILWLPSWYPNETDRFTGDFIQRHAYAAAINDDVHVLFVTKISGKENHQTLHQATGLTEQIIYFKSSITSLKNQILYFNFYRKAIREFIKKNGLPHFVHVHVPWKAGLVALWLKRKYGVPYIITEHWGIYNNIEKNSFLHWSFFNKKALNYIFSQAKRFISVSKFLGEGVNWMVVKKLFEVMPNVVDTTLFHFTERKPNEPFTFIHVSNGAAIKNLSGIIKSFSHYLKYNQETTDRLLIVGTKDKAYKALAEAEGLWNKHIFFIGEIPYPDVAHHMKDADALLLFSHMENSPCVIGEALCCGVPVIASNVGGIPELLDSTNGILVTEGDEHALAKAMEEMKKNYERYNRKEISEKAVKKFNYGTIAKQFHQLYHQ